MAKFYLINNVVAGTTQMSAGTLVDDAKEDVAPIQAAGGRLLPEATPGLAAAAAQAVAAKLRGAAPEQLEHIMVAAIEKEQQDVLGSTGSPAINAADLIATTAGKGSQLVGNVNSAGLSPGANLDAALTGLGLRANVVNVDGFIDFNVPDLSAFTGVTGGVAADGAKFKLNARVFLGAQTTAVQKGVYTVGAPVGGVAPLTRAKDWAVGQLLKDGTVVQVGGNNSTLAGAPHAYMDQPQDNYALARFTLMGDLVVGTDAIDGIGNQLLELETSTFQQRLFFAHMVHTANVADLTAFPMATNNDGQTAVETNVVVLGAQTTKAQNGPYICGPDGGGGTCKLVRPWWYAAGRFMPRGFVVRVMQGTKFAMTDWALFGDAGIPGLPGITVGTDDPKFRPLKVSGKTALVAGTFTVSLPVHSTSSPAHASRTVFNTGAATDGGYHPTVGGATGVVAGDLGTGQVTFEACVLAGTKNAADISTLLWTIENQL